MLRLRSQKGIEMMYFTIAMAAFFVYHLIRILIRMQQAANYLKSRVTRLERQL